MKTLIRPAARRVLPALAGLSMCITACSTTGTAVGRLEQPTGSSQDVTLVWKSNAADPDRGTISGTLPNGTHYSGRYFEVLKTADATLYGSAWEGWRPYWSGWRPGWRAGPIDRLDWPAFVTIYTGRVIANLKSDDDDTHLRCRFRVEDPREGFARGGHGDCQLSNGQSIRHVVVRAS